MKINNKILSIPPYISAPWIHIASIYTKNNSLFVHLTDNSTVEVPQLDDVTIENIFNMHALSVEEPPTLPGLTEMFNSDLKVPHMLMSQLMTNPQGISAIEMPFRLNMNGNPEEIMGSSIFQHNPDQKEIADIPNEILMKIVSIAKVVSSEDVSTAFPKPEPHCNCVHCQIGRTIHPELTSIEQASIVEPTGISQEEEPVTEEDLHFQKWKISRTGEQLYAVMNPDTNEKYSVHLGTPIGCTCGEANCEHIVAVLRS